MRPDKILWLIAVVLFVSGLLVSVFTPYKILLLFLPLAFAPALFQRRKDDEDDDRR